MTELRERVVARLVAAQSARDPLPLREPDAVGDALALLREAAPSPEGSIDLDAVAAVFWTFWLRHLGPDDPDAQQNMTVAVSAFGFLQPRVPEHVHFPEQLRDAFDPADQAHDARFAYLVSSAYGDAVLSVPDLGEPGRLAALDRALAWSDTAHHYLPDDHEGFVELAFHSLGLNVTRFQLAADPDALAAAARFAAAVCERMPSFELPSADMPSADMPSVKPSSVEPPSAERSSVERPSVGPDEVEAAAVAVGTLMDAARLLGEPALADVERLVAAAPDGALTPEAAEGLRFLRELDAEPAGWPGEVDLRVGSVIADAGIREHDAGRIACAVRRLRAALAHTPADHPAHPAATAALGQALGALARERGDDDAEREAVELLATVPATRTVSGADEELLAVLRDVAALTQSDDPHRFQQAGPLLGRIREQFEQRGGRGGGPSPAADIDVESFDLAAALVADPDAVSAERLARYRTALAALPTGTPHRYAYVAVLAALTGATAQALRETEPARAAQLNVEARSLTDEAAADAPAGFLPLGLLRRGRFDVALPVALSAIPTDEPDAGAADLRAMAPGNPLIGALADAIDGLSGPADTDLAQLVSLVSRLDDVRLDDPEHLGSDVEIMRDVLADLGEDDPSLRGALAAALGSALSAQATTHGDPAALDEVVHLLRYARSHASDLPEGLDQILAFALTSSSFGNFDAEAAREASALLASAAAEGAPADLEQAVLSARTDVFNAVGNYLLGHEPGQLARARELAQRLKDLTDRAAARPGNRPPGLDVLGDALLNLVDSVGPGGGPKPGLTDDQLDQCRRTFAACAAGNPMRLFTASTLMRVLTQRAVALRGADPQAAARLVAEAEEVVRTVEDEAPDGWADTMRMFIGVVREGRLPPLSPSHQPPRTPPKAPANAVEAMLASLRTRLSGTADPAAWSDPMVPVWFRAHGQLGAAAGALGMQPPRIDQALSHLEGAVEAMADITDRGSDQQSAEHGLTTFEGDIRQIIELVLLQALGREAAARVRAFKDDVMAALREQRLPQALPEPGALFGTVAGPDVDRATELLDRGRGLLLARRIEARADLGELRPAHPELADAFERLTDRLAAGHELPDPVPTGHAEWSRLDRLRASRELDALVERIRTQPGFDGFLRPLTAEQLSALASDGPIVVLNHARRYCHALVVTTGSITALRLAAEADEITDTARQLRDAIDAINAQGPSRRSPSELVAAGATVRRTLSWTWHTIVRPVLDLVGAGEPVPDEGAWPRIWWVPTGAFNALPLHAAQCTLPECELDGCGAALDAVVSSYAPGFQTLAHARTRAGHRGAADHAHALLVASPEDELPGVAAAAAYVAGLLGTRAPLVGAAATREAVLAALGSTSWAHFGCHATTDPAEPSGALLHLPSGEPLSVLEICRVRPRSARLAFLAACGTARTSERLADEAIHITSAFLLAGFPAAVGTLWEIDSAYADRVTRDFYRRTAGDSAATSAQALHHTVRELRRRIPDHPHVWAAYVHAGA